MIGIGWVISLVFGRVVVKVKAFFCVDIIWYG
jgi:hypothetical protein